MDELTAGAYIARYPLRGPAIVQSEAKITQYPSGIHLICGRRVPRFQKARDQQTACQSLSIMPFYWRGGGGVKLGGAGVENK